MASYKTFFRKTPRERLRTFITRRIADFPGDFDWQAKQTPFVDTLDSAIKALRLVDRDAIIAEIESIVELTDWAGQLAIEEICRAEHINIEACEGACDRAVLLALDYRDVFQFAAMEAGFRRRNGGRHWTNFSLKGEAEAKNLDDKATQDAFVASILAILDTHEDRRFDSDWYDAIRRDEHGERRTHQATIYVEQRRETELVFDNKGNIEQMPIQRVGEIGICYDPREGLLEVCAPGRKKQHDAFAKSFIRQFIGESVEAVAVPRRAIDFARLERQRDFPTEDADRIERYEISELILAGPNGRKATFEQRDQTETVYQFLADEFDDRSLLCSPGWEVVGATFRIVRAPKGGKGRKRTLVIDLRRPDRTNIRNRTDEDREFINMLFERWKIFAQDEDESDADLLATVNNMVTA